MRFIAEDDRLIIKFEGAEVLWAVRRKLSIPRSVITRMDFQPDFAIDRRILRLAGTNIPGVLDAGYFRSKSQNYFLYLQKPHGLSLIGDVVRAQNVLVITTHDYPYEQILLTCQPDIGGALLNWWEGKTAPDNAG